MLALLALSATAHAGASLQDQGIAAYDDFEYKKALRLLEEAVRAKKLPAAERARVHLYLGLVRFTLGDKDLAEVEFEQAITHNSKIGLPPDTSPKIEKFFKRIQKKTATAKAAKPEGTGGQEDSADDSAEVEAQLMQALPADAPAAEQGGDADASRAGSKPTSGGDNADASRAEGGTSSGEDSATAGPGDAAAAEQPADETAGDSQTPSVFSGKLWTWVAAGVSGALLFTGGAVGIAAHKDKQDFEDEKWGDRAARIEDNVESKSTAANVLFGLGSAVLAAAVVLFFIEGRPGPDENESRLSDISIGPAGVSASFRF